ncbi:helix-turn-helix domain-containing protein, partial [Bacillus subtilis]
MDRLTSMNVFVTVAESGSFAAAAGHLQISPQMVAKHIAMLEKHLGTLLLHRT